MAGRTGWCGGMAVAVVLFAGALPAAAGADVKAPAFSDYAAPTADQYGSPGGGNGNGNPGQPGSNGNAGGNGNGNGPPESTPAGGGRGGAAGKPDKPSKGGGRSGVKSAEASGTPGGAAGAQERGSALPLRDATGDGLPFTGFDLALVALLGVTLLAAGAALRLAVRTRAAARRAT
jgi:hypothetical protein